MKNVLWRASCLLRQVHLLLIKSSAISSKLHPPLPTFHTLMPVHAFIIFPSSISSYLPITGFAPKYPLSVGCLTVLLPDTFSSYSTSFQLFLPPKPINFHFCTPIPPLLQPPLINYLPIVYYLPSQFPQIIHWLVNISMPYPSCVCDNPKMSCLAQPLIQSLCGLLLSIHAVPSSLLSISFSGCKEPDSSSLSFIPPPSLPVASASPCLSQLFCHSQVPNPPLSLWAFPTYIPTHAVITVFQCSYQG